MKLLLPMCPVVLTLGLLVTCAPAFAQKDAPAESSATSPLAGSWKWDRVGVSGDVQCQLRFVENDGKLQGSYQDAEDVEADVKNVSLKDGRVVVTLVFDPDGKASEVKLTGKLEKDKITGTVNYSGGPQDWNARRFIALQDTVGTWQMDFTTPDGQNLQPVFELSVKDGKPVVKFTGDDDPSQEAEITGTRFKNGYLTIEMKLVFQDQPLSLEYELEMMTDRLAGLMYYQVGDDELMTGEIEIEGARIK